jgi:hypothetical protein
VVFEYQSEHNKEFQKYVDGWIISILDKNFITTYGGDFFVAFID